MNRFATLLVLAFMPGCLAQQIDARADANVAGVDDDAKTEMFSPTCADGALLEAHCGLVTEQAALDARRASFAAAKCNGMSADVCDTAYRRAIAMSLAMRYPHANVTKVAAACAENPARCEDASDREKLLLASENASLRAREAKAKSEIEADRRNEHAIDRANAEAARDAIASMIATVALPCVRGRSGRCVAAP